MQPCTLTALLPGRTGHQQAPKLTPSSHRPSKFQVGSMCLGSCGKWPHFFIPQRWDIPQQTGLLKRRQGLGQRCEFRLNPRPCGAL